jgi:hypothetical protein
MKKSLIFLIFVMNLSNFIKRIDLNKQWNIVYSQPTAVEVFMDIIGQLESGGEYNKINNFGMLGKYQFSSTTIKYLGFDVSPDEFLRDPVLQDSVMVEYMKHNYENLKDLIDEYDGVEQNGIILNRAAILAGAHFAGAGGIKSYIRSPRFSNIRDSNNMTVDKYISSFQDLNLPSL